MPNPLKLERRIWNYSRGLKREKTPLMVGTDKLLVFFKEILPIGRDGGGVWELFGCNGEVKTFFR